MNEVRGCFKHFYVHNGKDVEAIRFQENAVVIVPQEMENTTDMERSPVCGRQLISCSCFGYQIEIVTEHPALSPADLERAKPKS